MRRTIQQLQQRLERYERQTPPRHEEHHADEDDEDINLFHNEDNSSNDSYPHQIRQNLHRGREGDVKIDVPEFDGHAQRDAFLDWLCTIKRIFDFKDYSEEKKKT